MKLYKVYRVYDGDVEKIDWEERERIFQERKNKMYDLFENSSEEEIREKLKELPYEDPNLIRRMGMTGSGMTEHGFSVGSGAFGKDEAEDIFLNIKYFDRKGKRRKEVE